jgi:hypothetical protein
MFYVIQLSAGLWMKTSLTTKSGVTGFGIKIGNSYYAAL